DHFKDLFHELAENDRQEAFRYINEEKLQFPCLFILMPEIEALNLYENLNARNIKTLKICAKKLNNQSLVSRVEQVSSRRDYKTYEALKWMFETGLQWEGPDGDNNTYDAIIDTVVALLIQKYGEKTILPAVADLIFKRNQKGLFIHDLVWDFFQEFDPASLRLVAKRLLSNNPKDVELACKLLHLQLPPDTDKKAAKKRLYKQYLSWLKENSPFLYLTGEFFQLSSDPEHINIDLEAKYLCKKISYRNRKPVESFTEKEIGYLKKFRENAAEEQKILSTYSHKIHRRNMRSWQQWLQKRTEEQLDIAKADLGVGP
ncbi:MAG: hypothetical protein ACOX7H_09345, partial [Bacillota bacterium]